MKRFILLWTIMVCQFSLAWEAAQAAAPNGTIKELQIFENQLQIMEVIYPYVMREQLPRLAVVEKNTRMIVEDIQQNVSKGRSAVTFNTVRLIQSLIMQYRFSQSFFGWLNPIPITSIYAEKIAAPLRQLRSLSNEMEQIYGYDDSPYTKITANTFRQMQRLLKDLEALPLDPSLKQDLRKLWGPIGSTVSIAEQGDRPNAFNQGILVVQRIRQLYPLFNQLQAMDAGFTLVLEFQGLVEFYADFAQETKP